MRLMLSVILSCALMFGAVLAVPWINQLPLDETSWACCVLSFTSNDGGLSGAVSLVASVGMTDGSGGTGMTNQGGMDIAILIFDSNFRGGEEGGQQSPIGSILIGTGGDEVATNVAFDTATNQIVLIGATTGNLVGEGQSQSQSDLFMSFIDVRVASPTRVTLAVSNTIQCGPGAGENTPFALLQLPGSVKWVGLANSVGTENGPYPTGLGFIRSDNVCTDQNFQTKTNVANGYFSGYNAATRTGEDVFAFVYEIAVNPDGAQRYGVEQYAFSGGSFESQFTITLEYDPVGAGGLAFESSSITFDSSQDVFALAGVRPGYLNTGHNPASTVLYSYFAATFSSETDLTVTLVGDSEGENAVVVPVQPQMITAGEAGYAAFTKSRRTRVPWAGRVVAIPGLTEGEEFQSAGNPTADIVNQLVGFVAPPTTASRFSGYYYGQAFAPEENPFNCVGGPDRKDFAMSGLAFSGGMVSESWLFTVPTQCSEVAKDAVLQMSESSDRPIFVTGTTTGSLTGSTPPTNGGQTTVQWTMRIEPGTGQLPPLNPLCDLPCMSLPPPTPSPTPSPTPEPTPSPSPTPDGGQTPTPTPVPTPVPTPTPTIGPLPVSDSVDGGVIAGAVVGAIAGSLLVVGIGAWIYKYKSDQAAEGGFGGEYE